MDSERWKKIKEILEEAIEMPSDEQPEYLKNACHGDADLRREVESLLEFKDTKSDLLERTAFSAVLKDGFEASGKSFIGRQIGNYKIVDELGAGGMGVVLLAERADGTFAQRVALKLIKRGMDSEAVLRRFINERQILASLEHPNIARLLDGGTTDDNLPYFVMEYVEGETITDFAERENLELDARLKLFQEVCAAVSFAHRNLVIHRDLKPSNILVTADGTPKLLDFGIAKLLKSETGNETATQNFIFTPEYASPEQARGEKLTTATDVYSLGVILYELFTGERPYKTADRNLSEVIRLICETEPSRPSSVVLCLLTKTKLPRTMSEGQRTKDKEQIQNPKSKIQNHCAAIWIILF